MLLKEPVESNQKVSSRRNRSDEPTLREGAELLAAAGADRGLRIGALEAIKRALQRTKHSSKPSGKDTNAEAPGPLHTRPGRYEKLAKPYVLPNQSGANPCLFFGGLAGTGHTWQDFATKLHLSSGARSEVYPLRGHEGSWEALKQVHWRDWVSDIVEKAKSQEEPPVFFGFSTSAAAGLVAAAENPGLFRAMVLVGTPLALRDGRHEALLRVGLAMEQVGLGDVVENMTLRSKPNDSKDRPRTYRRSPVFRSVPAPTLLNLWRVSRAARDAIEKVSNPMLLVQGGQDHLVSRSVLDFAARKAPDFATVALFERSGHGVPLDKQRYKLLSMVRSWMQETLLPSTSTS